MFEETKMRKISLVVALIAIFGCGQELFSSVAAKSINNKPSGKGFTVYPLDVQLAGGVEALSATNDRGLVQKYEKATRALLPSVADADARLLWEAAILAAKKDYEGANDLLLKVKHLDHGSPYSLKYAAKTKATMMQNEQAIKICTLALSKHKDEWMLTTRASCFMAQKQFAEAAKDYVAAATLGYKAANYCRAASCLLSNREPEKALVLAEKSFEGAGPSDLAGCYFSKGMCLQSAKRYKEAIASFTSSLDTLGKQSRRADKTADGHQDLLTGECLNERSKCYEKLGMIAQANSDRQRKAEIAKKIEQELFGK